ncbi:receptor-interacting serine/threonine-protein kinase 4-like [Schistocerca cancellata]|uniref:receptor-interacting serine/threonine-protein kinase 4-like n=1 Tax=Schistocerca cancellata TaxID=274614 RepID=UPI0021180129|nr:receptor-interacting serine/threonine-protein kinase 4-like [Schistocerca cancellata]
MFCGSISWFICIFVAVVITVNCSDSDSITGPDLEVNVLRLRSENPGQSTVEPETEAKETPVVDLSALLDAGEGAVVTLVAGDTRLAAHRAVLASRSPVFEAMFRQDPLEASSGLVAVQDVDGPVLRQLLAYLYTLQAPRLPDLSAQLLAAADKFGVSALKAECELQLAAQLSVETAAAVAALAVRHSSDSLKQAAIKFIRAHLIQVIFTRGWADAVRSQPQDMADVYRLLLETPIETSTPAVADSDSRATPTPATEPHSDHSGTPATAAPPTTQRPAAPPDGNALSLLRYADAHREANTGTPLQTPSNTTAQRKRPPATADGRTTPATELHSNRGWTSVTAAPPTTLHSTLWPDGSTASTLHTPATTDSSVAPTTQLQSNHGDHSRASASAATPTAASPTPSTDSAAITLLRSISGEEKGRRLIHAAKEGAVEELQALLKAGADVEAMDGNMETALHWAAKQGHVEVARHLLEAGAEVEARNDRKSTPLQIAAENGHAAMVRLLIASNADLNARNQYETTAMQYAAVHGHTEIVKTLLEAKAEVDARNEKQSTALHISAWKGHTAVVRLLLASKANPNAVNKFGMTPLHYAAQQGHSEVATLLLEAGANREARDNDGNTSLDLARLKKLQKLIDMLR